MKLLHLSLATLALSLAAPHVSAQMRARLIAEGTRNPTDIAQAPGDDTRFFVTGYNHGIYVVENGVVLPDLFLDLRPFGLGAQSVTSLAFHPDYQTNGKFYVLYYDSLQQNNLVEYTVSSDPNLADPNSRVQILGPDFQTGIVHHWDQIDFGIDGMLYLSTGDGVMSNNTTDNNAQDLGSIFGKMLRIDVTSATPYAIPPDNPFVGLPGVREEVWMYGLRQPWRFDFDPLNNDLYIGDVGSSTAEEINVLPASAGAGKNFGWRCIEGDTCKNFPGCIACTDASLIDPVHFFPHTEFRCAVVGGIVYRGTQVPELDGRYLFADYCSSRIWTFEWDGSAMQDFAEWTDLFPTDQPGERLQQIAAFGRDHTGELYILDRSNNGRIWKIEPDPCQVLNYCQGGLNSNGTRAAMSTSGLASVTALDFMLHVQDAVAGQFGLFYYGPNQIQVPFGDGDRCVGGVTWRLNPAQLIDATGSAERLIDFAMLPVNGQILAGSEWNFQFWYRDPAAAASGFNLSDALNVTFCP